MRDMIFSAISYLLVFVLIFLFAFLFSRFTGRRFSFKKRGRNMSVVESIYFTQKTALSIISIKDEYYLISISENGVDILKKLEGNYSISGNKDTDEKFSEIIKNIMGRNLK